MKPPLSFETSVTAHPTISSYTKKSESSRGKNAERTSNQAYAFYFRPVSKDVLESARSVVTEPEIHECLFLTSFAKLCP
jgi:hypothetical protein